MFSSLDTTVILCGRRRGALLASAIIILAAVGVLVVLAMIPTKADELPPATMVPVNVTVRTIEAIPSMADVFELTAVVEPYSTVTVSSEVAARVLRYAPRSSTATWRGQTYTKGPLLDDGHPIGKGDTILYLDDSLFKAEMARAQAQLDYDQSEYLRVEKLFKTNSASLTIGRAHV